MSRTGEFLCDLPRMLMMCAGHPKQQVGRLSGAGMRSSGRVLVLILLGLFSFRQVGQAADFVCAAGNVPCLIAAIQTANANGKANTITLAKGTYSLTAADNFVDGAPNGLPPITSPLTINGAGEAATTIASFGSRLIYVAATGNLTLQGLTLSGGRLIFPSVSISRAVGGAVFNNGGRVTIIGSTLASNFAYSGGGGIYNDAGIVQVIHSTLVGNGASNGGAGITNLNGVLTITDSVLISNTGLDSGASGGGIVNVGNTSISGSTFNGNRAGGGIGFGGAIFNVSTLTITNSTFGGNNAGSGGAISNFGRLTVTNTSLLANRATASGGGIENYGSLQINSSTLAGNAASCGGGITSRFGSSINLQNTILASNVANSLFCLSSVGTADCFGSITSLNNNLVGDPTGCTLTLLSKDLTGDPGFDAFNDNGTPGNGHLSLLPISRAIDAGNDGACSPRDQLGKRRFAHCDIGAIEFQPPMLTVSIEVQPGRNPASINPKNSGVIPVAVLTTGTFDASTVDPATARFGQTGAEAAAVQSALEDVNGDGSLDMILRFRTRDTGIACDADSASLTAETFSKQAIQGFDSIVTAGCSN